VFCDCGLWIDARGLGSVHGDFLVAVRQLLFGCKPL